MPLLKVAKLGSPILRETAQSIEVGSLSSSNIELQKSSITNFSCIESKTECEDT